MKLVSNYSLGTPPGPLVRFHQKRIISSSDHADKSYGFVMIDYKFLHTTATDLRHDTKMTLEAVSVRIVLLCLVFPRAPCVSVPKFGLSCPSLITSSVSPSCV